MFERAGKELRPSFAETGGGRLFCLYYPGGGLTPATGILHVPALADELNKSRRMVAQQSLAFSRLGASVMVLDLFGTGDSDGDFSEATWDIWRRNVGDAVGLLREAGADRVIVWGARLGCLLAAECAAAGEARIHALLLWNPVANGSVWLNQFLRIRAASEMLKGGGASVDRIKQDLRDQGRIEVGGYELSTALAESIGRLSLAGSCPPAGMPVLWAEVSATGRMPPASARLIQSWRENGVRVNDRAVTGAQFWSTQEIAEVPGLVSDTTELVKELLHA